MLKTSPSGNHASADAFEGFTMTTANTTKIVAEICLYGTSRIGAGWLAQTARGERLGTGEPVADRGFTDAIFEALRAIETLGVFGAVAVYDAGGERVAIMEQPTSYGMLEWRPALVYVLPASELIVAADRA